MRFIGDPSRSSVHNELPGINVDCFISILRGVAGEVGEETREKMHKAIDSVCVRRLNDDSIPFWDTPIFGHFYVYLWFDLHGELFYIGKGTGNRVRSTSQRSTAFREKEASGYYKILASNLSEDYALDLEKILIMEATRCGKALLNRACGDAQDGIHYCSGDREILLYYWDHLGVISRFSQLTNIDVFYDARNISWDALDERVCWWEFYHDVKTNNPEILAQIREAEEKERKRKEKARMYQRKRREQKAS